MKQIWAPWRMEYIRMEKTEGCVLCDKPGENNDETNHILHRGAYNFVIMNMYPYNPGHLLIAPYRHIAGIDEMNTEERNEHFEIVSRCISLIKEEFNPGGLNVGINMGKVAGAGIADHVHTHVVPRWQGDTNFMPVIGETRVIPQALIETYRFLKGKFK